MPQAWCAELPYDVVAIHVIGGSGQYDLICSGLMSFSNSLDHSMLSEHSLLNRLTCCIAPSSKSLRPSISAEIIMRSSVGQDADLILAELLDQEG